MILASAVLVSAFQWNLALVFSTSIVGSLLGSFIAFGVGRKWQEKRARKEIDTEREKRTLDQLVHRFRKHGPAYLIVSRFIPGFRSLFLVAAGMTGMTTKQVLFYSGISSILWTTLLFAGGYAVGSNLESLKSILSNYNKVAFALIALGLAIAMARWLKNRYF